MSTSFDPNIHTHYHITRWSEGYFAINPQGEVVAKPCHTRQDIEINFTDLVESAKNKGLRLPILFRFTDILKDRVKKLYHAFDQAIQSNQYSGQYQAVYPIKVNQQKRVVEAIIQSSQPVGLEAGSKPELIAVLAHSKPNQSVIICNGYKDKSYIRLALLGQQIGHRVFLVIEKFSEVNLILNQAKLLGIKPNIGVRVRLATVGNSNWQNTGGEKAKFGLTSFQVLQLVEKLKQENLLDCLQLLHVHMGSQITNLTDIENAVQECTQFYIHLRKLNAPIDYIDVGGGLGIDYEGTQSRHLCSINYSMHDYANAIIATITRNCQAHQQPHPNIITEAGRAMSAHHAVLVTNIVDIEKPTIEKFDMAQTLPLELHKFVELQCEIERDQPKISLTEIFHQSNHELSKIYQQFSEGKISLSIRAQAEKMYFSCCQLLKQQLRANLRSHRDIIDQLNEKLATKLFVNFSVFQSVPDVWGINQIFPIVPLAGLNQPANTRAVIHDLTCDSDGRIDQYVDNSGIETTLPIKINDDAHTTLLGFFLVGAYQEILGDLHNLFGDTDTVDVTLNENGDYLLDHQTQGDNIASVLKYVNFKPDDLIQQLQNQVNECTLSDAEKKQFFAELNNAFNHYTYFD